MPKVKSRGPFIVEAAQVSGLGLRLIPADQLLAPVVSAAIEAQRAVDVFMTTAGKEKSTKGDDTWANQAGAVLARQSIKKLADVLQRHWGSLSDPGSRSVQVAGVPAEINVVVNSLWQTVDAIHSGMRQRSSSLPNDVYKQFAHAVTVLRTCAEALRKQQLTSTETPPPRLSVSNGPQPRVVLDGIAYDVPSEVADLFRAAIDAGTGYVSLRELDVRGRQIDALPKPLRNLLERSPGKGCRIVRTL